VELGAEFIHGGNRAIKKVLKKANLETHSVKCNIWWQDGHSGKLESMPDYWDRIGKVAGRIPRREHGWSFDEFLRHERGKISAFDHVLAEHYIGSFNAADTAKISTHALRQDRAGTKTDDLKIKGRYDAIVRQLQRDAISSGIDLRLESPVTSVRWSRGKVTVRTRLKSGATGSVHQSRAVLVTVPLGVLKAGRITFAPALREKQTLIKKLGWGHVVRIVIRFKPGFWSAPFMPGGLGARDGQEFGFVNSPAQPLPVWWALNPPAPILTGWVGGNPARLLSRKSPSSILTAAVRSFAFIVGTTPDKVRAWIADWQFHQWGDDPFSLGAYSYPVAGLEDGPAQLAEPVESTIFFAGEATAAEYGTVHGALESGLRAAKEIGAALNPVLFG
jgi:monoamine oxidase